MAFDAGHTIFPVADRRQHISVDFASRMSSGVCGEGCRPPADSGVGVHHLDVLFAVKHSKIKCHLKIETRIPPNCSRKAGPYRSDWEPS